MDKTKPFNQKPLVYCAFFPILREIANERGWALAIHGSVVRDFDLIAVQWEEGSCDAETLIAAFCEATGGISQKVPTNEKPNRSHYAVMLWDGGYLDIFAITLV